MRTLFLLCLLLFAQTTNNYKWFDPPPRQELSEWDKLIIALSIVESNQDSLIINHLGATGLLQIMPIYVKDVNRILGYEKYKMSCALSATKSIEMFNIYQMYYNPNRDIHKAIQLHNPKAGEWYLNKVIRELNKLK